MTKLLGRLEDELVKERARFERNEDRKRTYKQLARQFHTDL